MADRDDSTVTEIETPWEVREHPGCYAGPEAPLVASYQTLAEAVRHARTSDRLQVTREGHAVWAPPQRGGRHGPGRYGSSAQAGEPSVAASVREAKEEWERVSTPPAELRRRLQAELEALDERLADRLDDDTYAALAARRERLADRLRAARG